MEGHQGVYFWHSVHGLSCRTSINVNGSCTTKSMIIFLKNFFRCTYIMAKSFLISFERCILLGFRVTNKLYAQFHDGSIEHAKPETLLILSWGATRLPLSFPPAVTPLHPQGRALQLRCFVTEIGYLLWLLQHTQINLYSWWTLVPVVSHTPN